jgi:hypothetical protein
MSRRTLARLLVVAAGAGTLPACTDTLATRDPQAEVRRPDLLGQALPGLYQLTFVSAGQTVTSLPVGSEVSLRARVESATGTPATSGTVTFQYCSLKGLPPNDITRADEAPKAACETGAGTWSRLITVKPDASGIPLVNFPAVTIPRTVGFRFRYSGGASAGIANGSAAEDFTWCPLTGCQ